MECRSVKVPRRAVHTDTVYMRVVEGARLLAPGLYYHANILFRRLPT